MKKEVLCPLPFIQLNLYPGGGVLPCCLLSHYPVGNVNKEEIQDIWNNEKMQNLREEFISGNIKTCKNQIGTYKCYERHQHLQKEIEVKKRQDNFIKRLDVRLNGKCNLECIMCEVWTYPNDTYNEDNFWDNANKEIFP